MKSYKSVPLEKAYKLLNTGAIILVSTQGADGVKNITPIAWNTLIDYEPVTRLLFVCDKEHKTYANIMEVMRFVVVLPHVGQTDIVKKLGTSSGNFVNKIEALNINVFDSDKYKYSIPENSIAYLECTAYKIIDEGGVAIVFGEVENAQVDIDAYSDRLLSELDAGKTLHHLGGKKFVQPGDVVF